MLQRVKRSKQAQRTVWHEMGQDSDEWLQVRVGKATASRFSDVMATIKSGESASRKNYRAELVAERLSGVPYPQFVSREMQFGTDNEPFAREFYEIETGAVVKQVGFIEMVGDQIGYSPDGAILSARGTPQGIIEVKCPNTATHLKTILNGMDPGHIPQVQGGMWLADVKWCDFISFDPRLPEEYQLYIQRIKRDNEYIAKLKLGVAEFLNSVDRMLEDIKEARVVDVEKGED